MVKLHKVVVYFDDEEKKLLDSFIEKQSTIIYPGKLFASTLLKEITLNYIEKFEKKQ